MSNSVARRSTATTEVLVSTLHLGTILLFARFYPADKGRRRTLNIALPSPARRDRFRLNAMPRKRSRDEVWGTLRRASVYLMPYRARLGGVFALIIAFSLFSLVFPALMGGIIDFATGHHASNRFVSLIVPKGAIGMRALLPLFLLYALMLIARAAALLTRNHLMQTTGMRVTCDLRIAVFSHLQKLSIRFYEERQTGRVVARVTEDAASMHQLVANASVNLIGELTMAVGVLVLLFAYSWKLALISVTIIPLFIFNYFWHRRRMRMESRRHRRHWSKLVGFLNERIANNRVVRAFATEGLEENSFRGGIQADFANYNRLIWRSTLLSATADFLSGIGTLLILAFGAVMIYKSLNAPAGAPRFTIGDLSAFLAYLAQLYGPIVRVFDANAIIQAGVTSMERIFAILDTSPHIPDNDALPQLPRIAGKIEFRDVSFAYRIGQATLEHVNFTVEPGEMVALVGPSGAGKSTIITLLARFYDPTAGAVLIDNQPITGFNVQSVRRQVGIVMQDNILFSGSIADNIRYGRPDATHEEVIAASVAANCHEFVSKLKNGYDSRVGERGVSLSGGQRQRLAIARVLLRDPRILILDEATSALDSQSERLIQDATEKLMENRTAIVIAHRLSTVVNADRILVMDHGRIVDFGRHEELLARPGLYRDLYQLQFEERAES
jgi:subfamily B ATP-binding cassette protein MsbA